MLPFSNESDDMQNDNARACAPLGIPARLDRRRFLARTAALSASGLWGHGAMASDDDGRNRAQEVLGAALSVDMHSHVGGSSLRKQVDDFPGIADAGLSAVCLSLVSDSPVLGQAGGRLFMRREPLPDELYHHMLERLDFADRAIESHRLRRIHGLADLQSAKQSGVAGIILSTEGGDFLDGKLERLETLRQRGVRHFQLVHYRQGNGIGDIQTEMPVAHGATPFGLDVVRACNRLGIVVDVAHATIEAVRQVVKVADQPLVLSHTAHVTRPKAWSRHIDTEHARLVRDTGGVVGVWTNASDFPDAASFATGVAKMAEVVGAEHVGIGTDLNGLVHPLLKSYADFPGLVAALFKHFNDDEVRGIVGGNYLRVFDRVTAGKPA